MSVTDELRRMLTEAGVEWDYGITGAASTKFDANGVELTFIGMRDGVTCSTILTPAQAIAATLGPKVTGDTSDGYHTFNELYHHRAVLFSVIVRDHRELAWKSKAHHDGTMYDGMFIVGIETPKGQATYHYDIDPYWDMFDCKEFDRAPEWDGHSPADAIERIAALGRGTCWEWRWPMATDYTIPKEEYRALVAENERLQEQSERIFDKTLELATENDRLRELLDFALPIAMYAASAEEGDRIRELMREVEL